MSLVFLVEQPLLGWNLSSQGTTWQALGGSTLAGQQKPMSEAKSGEQ